MLEFIIGKIIIPFILGYIITLIILKSGDEPRSFTTCGNYRPLRHFIEELSYLQEIKDEIEYENKKKK